MSGQFYILTILEHFLKDDSYAPKLPKWAYKVILEPEELEAEEIRREEEEKKAKREKEVKE